MSLPCRDSLRLAIITDDTQVPRYVSDALRAVSSARNIVFLGTYVLGRRPERRWADRLFAGLDIVEAWLSRIRGRSSGDFGGADLGKLLPGRILGVLDVVRSGDRLAPDAAALGQLHALVPDVLLCCTSVPLELPQRIARFGALGIELGYGVPVHAAWAGAAELAQGSTVMITRLVDYAAPQPLELYRACDPLVPTSLRQNRRNAFLKGSGALRRQLQSLHQATDWPQALPRLQDLPTNYPIDPRPMTSLFLATIRQMSRRMLRNRFNSRDDGNAWHLAYTFSDIALPDIDFAALRYLAPAPGAFWADPFPLIHQGRHYILFEELPYDTLRGRLLAIEVAEDGPAGAPMTVLERGYHLSYPQVFHWDGDLYMVPETRQARRIELLRCKCFPSDWEVVNVMIDGIRAVDATVWRQDESWWLFANVALDGVETADELHLYFSDSLFGEWLPHPANPLCADVRCARPAGPLFVAGGETFRPSQDGARSYGDALWINRIERLDRTAYREESVRRIAPDWHPHIRRVHTLGRAGRLTVLDCVVADRGGLNIQHTSRRQGSEDRLPTSIEIA